MKVIYPVLFYEEKEGGYSVFVPDLQNNSTCGSTLEEAMSMAEDLIAGIVLDEMEENNKIPQSSKIEDVTFEELEKDLRLENWDYISIQQNSGDSGISSSYSPYLEDLITYIYNTANEEAKIVFNMTWAYQQNSTHQEFVKYNKNQITMYEAIVEAVKEKVRSNEDISMVIPVGTAIQNARTSFVGDTLTRDGYHLTYDFGRYVAGLTFVKQLTGLDISNVTFKPSKIDDSYRIIAIESAINAVEHPEEITESQYK